MVKLFHGKYKKAYRHTSDNGRPRGVHLIIAEQVLGRPMPKGAGVHHVDGDGHNNAHRNLVIYPTQAYHLLLHKRQRAFNGCGNANWIKCDLCKQWDDPTNLRLSQGKNSRSPNGRHLSCDAKYARDKRAERRLANIS